jgi:hypothetical protein
MKNIEMYLFNTLYTLQLEHTVGKCVCYLSVVITGRDNVNVDVFLLNLAAADRLLTFCDNGSCNLYWSGTTRQTSSWNIRNILLTETCEFGICKPMF